MKVGDDFLEIPRLKELIDTDVKAANERLEGFERIKKYTILNERFSEENGYITPTQKTKKRVILKDFADTIEKMYS